jgi:hypothetical protein
LLSGDAIFADMKTKHTLLIFGFGYCLSFIGTLEKILHTNLADFTLTIATLLEVLGVLLSLYKLLTNPKAKDFLNW